MAFASSGEEGARETYPLAFAARLGLLFAWMAAAALGLCDSARALPINEVGYDDDNELDFVWTPPQGSFDHYNVYVSIDGGEYQLQPSHPSTEAYTVAAENGHTYRVKVAAVTSEGVEGPFSPESDPVICDTLAPLAPTFSESYEVLDQTTALLTLTAGPSDAHFSNYQVLGGQYADWTDIAETATFLFSVDPDSQNILQIREKDLAGNVGAADSLTVENLNGDNDSDGMPNYWELMYSGILDPDNPGDAALDSDGDGWSNYQEYVAGTEPTETGSAPSDSTPPVITLLGENPVSLECGNSYAEPGYTATDNRDGDITSTVLVEGYLNHAVLGTYILRYNVSDSSGNPAQEATRSIEVVDTAPPVITLLGDSSMVQEAGRPFDDPGYVATDDYDGDVTEEVTVSGDVAYDTPGIYTLVYTGSDKSGNVAIAKTRRVNVVDVSAFQVVDLVRTEGGILDVEWTSQPDCTYSVQSCTDLGLGVWKEEAIVFSGGEATNWSDTDTRRARKFYRIEVR